MGQWAEVWSAMIRCWSVMTLSTSAWTGRSSITRISRTNRSAWPHISSSKTSLGRLNTSRKSSIPGPLTLFTPARAAISALPKVSAPAWASRIGASESAMYDWQGSSSALATAV